MDLPKCVQSARQKGGVERHRIAVVTNGGVVFFDPRDSEDNVMCGRRNVEPDRLFITCYVKGEGVVVSDVSAFRGTPVGKDEGDGGMLGKVGKLVVRGQCIINKASLSAGV